MVKKVPDKINKVVSVINVNKNSYLVCFQVYKNPNGENTNANNIAIVLFFILFTSNKCLFK